MATVNTTSTVTRTFGPDADAYVDATVPTSNFGTANRVYVDGSPNRQGYLRFTVTGVTGHIQSAKLRLYISDGTIDGPQVYATSNTWNESGPDGITWNNKPAPIGPASDDKGAITTNTWVEFEVTPLVAGNGTYSFVLVPTSTDGINIYSREASTTANRPQLVLTESTK
jgi:hypothetical protein